MDFGQVKIFEDYFPYLDESTIKYSPKECIEYKKTFSALYENAEIPIMVGTKYTKNNPLSIVGYFIIDGLCYSMNNMFIKIKNNFRNKTAYFTDGSKIVIKSMFEYTMYNKGKASKWNIPINWNKICKEGDDKLYNHLSIIDEFSKYDKSKIIKNEIDLESLRSMFRLWLGIIEEPDYNFRLATPGEIIYDMFINEYNIIDAFRNNTWAVKHILNVTSVSEPMKHYNIYSDIESIRRVTFPTNRENMTLLDRQVKFNEKYKLCPIQTPDGQLCGTVKYLVKDAKLITEDFLVPELESGDIRVILNGNYLGSFKTIEPFKNNCDIIIFENYAYISSLKGRIIGQSLLSYTANKIPYLFHNPPVRATFMTSMLKQSIEYNKKYNFYINDTKFLTKDLEHKFNVAIMPWFGYNIEDSLVISKSVSEHFNYVKQQIYRETKKVVKIYVKKNTIVEEGDILYKVYDPTEIQTLTKVYAKSKGVVVRLKKSPFKLVIHNKKDLQVGDKMTSLHGQKGIISLILNNPPYYIENNVKKNIDIIINPHAFPSRMTIGQIKEMGESYKDVYIDGVKIKNKIMVGTCVYLALRHQVDDKLQYCNNDSFDIISKQPKEGKKNKGGLRFGQMERDILLAINAFQTIKEIWDVDKIKIPKSKNTGIFYSKENSEMINSNQYFVICLSYLRALGYDIILKEDKYSIIDFDSSSLPVSKEKYFGSEDPSDLRIYRNIITLPNCLRNNTINSLISRSEINIKALHKEYRKLLTSKNGAFHKFFEGHRSNHCFRSVISPDPNLPLDVVKIPYGANIGTNICILNRQPTLNISSMRFMKIQYKEEKTISFNPLLCKSFNADFDGDEMNLYGLMNKNLEKELIVLNNDGSPVQDYILQEYLGLTDLTDLTFYGITFTKEDIKTMIDSKSKGKEFNYNHMFIKIGKVTYNDKEYEINECYYDSISPYNWYLLSMITRNNTASIALNTPISGYLQSITNQLILGSTELE
nr:RNA polymerase [Saccharomycopsis crataegensis]